MEVGIEMDRWMRVVGAVLILCASQGVSAPPASAQETVVVDGRVTSAGGPAIAGARVELQGYPSIPTRVDGRFRFEGVVPGRHTLRVEAFGYATVSRAINVDGDLTIAVELDVAPFELDSIGVSAERIDMEGVVRDAQRGIPLRDAQVRTNQGHEVWTDNGGGFDVEVWEEAPILVQLRAFGYFGVDTVVVPDPDLPTVFRLTADSLVERLIATEVRRIEERAGGRLAVTMRPLDRDDLLRWDNATLSDVLRAEYPIRMRRVRCVVVDEVSLLEGMAEGVLLTTLAREVERMEFLFDGAMLRVYTRDFMRTMLGSGIELRRAKYVDWADPPLCA